MAVLLDLQRPGPAVLDRVAQPVQRPDARIASPREDELARAAHADHLVIDQVGGHTYKGELTPALPDDLVAGREWYQVGKALQRQGHTVLHVGTYRVA